MEIKKKAEEGFAKPQYALGTMYYRGENVKQDYEKAFKWFSKAAEQGETNAQCHLGDMYYNGKYVQQDSKEAVKWYTIAAEKDNLAAQIELCLKCVYGEGVAKNRVETYKWCKLANSHHLIRSDDAEKTLGLVVQQMTPEQIADGERLVKEFKLKKMSSK